MSGKKKIDEVLNKIEKIFQDELIHEVCQLYAQLVIDHELDELSLKKLLTEYQELFEDYEYDGHYTWIALAYLQFELGLLESYVKEKALEVIEDEIKKLNHSKRIKLSKEALFKYKQAFNSTMPNRIVVRKPKYFKCQWEIGDVFAVRLDDEIYNIYGLQGKYVMFVKVDEHIYYPKHVGPKILCFNWYGDEPLQEVEKIKKLDFLPTFIFNNTYFNYKIFVIIENEKEIDKINLRFICNINPLKLPQNIENDIMDESKKRIMSIKKLKRSMIPINLFIKENYKIRPNNYQIVEIK